MSSGSPVVLIHGMGSTFEHNWVRSGWVDLLSDEGYDVHGFELSGHGARPPVTGDPDEIYDDLAALLKELDHPAVVGFSAGARLTLGMLMRSPGLFSRAALLGIGDAMLIRDPDGSPGRSRLAGQIESADGDSDVMARLIRQMCASAGNDPAAVATYVRAMPTIAGFEALPSIDVPVLVVLGENDNVAPADRIVAGLPDAELVILPRTDHFATTSNFTCQAKVLEFLAS